MQILQEMLNKLVYSVLKVSVYAVQNICSLKKIVSSHSEK